MLSSLQKSRRVARVLVGCAAGLLIVGPVSAVSAGGERAPTRDLRLHGTVVATSLDIADCTASTPDVPVTIRARVQLPGLGRTTMLWSARATCVAFPDGSGYLLGEMVHVRGTYVAANGDRLFFVGSGSAIGFEFNDDFTMLTGTFHSVDHFTGGTGHFRGATGHQTMAFTHLMWSPALDLSAEVRGSVHVSKHHSD